MTTAEIEAAVREAMELVLGPDEVPAGNVTRAATPSWDSLKHVELVFTVEDACEVSLESCALGELDSLDDIVAAVAQRSPGSGR